MPSLAATVQVAGTFLGAAGVNDPYAAPEFAMMTFINTHSKGLTILPTHRLIRNVANFNFDKFRDNVAQAFDWYSYPFQNPEERASAYAEFRKDLEGTNHGRRAIGIYPGGGAFYIFLLRRDADLEAMLPDVSEAQRGLDVVLLHRLILEKALGISAEAVAAEKNVVYEREMDAALAAVDRGEAQLACLLNPVRVQQVADIALGGDVLPSFLVGVVNTRNVYWVAFALIVLVYLVAWRAVNSPPGRVWKRSRSSRSRTSRSPICREMRRACE